MVPELSAFGTTSVFMCIQSVYIIIHLIIRPMKEVKDQLFEVVNELTFIALIIILFFWSKEKDWSELKSTVYIWIMVGNTVVFCVISLSIFYDLPV